MARSIHAKCSVLASALCLIGCPVKALARAVSGSATVRADLGPERLQPIDKVL